MWKPLPYLAAGLVLIAGGIGWLAVGRSRAEQLMGECRRAASRGVQNPTEAQFPGLWDTTLHGPIFDREGGATWYAWVESPNLFGGASRRSFICRYSPDTRRVRVEWR